jgi:CRISPR-associated endonuclease/helicase Cas3
VEDEVATKLTLAQKLFSAGPWPWQQRLADRKRCDNLLIRIPTGFGKTLGVLHAWLQGHFEQADERWPTRLIWCLPMRVLVEQTEDEVRKALATCGLESQVDVHVLMGGVEATEFSLYPERKAVLIGTQDMLLSRAMNRGYAAARARWPVEFGMLSQDCLWVMDEVQLMDVGLATSAQLQAFWTQSEHRGHSLWPNRSWWMSATLQPAWLQNSPDTVELVREPPLTIPETERRGALWEDVKKPLEVIASKDAKAIAKHAILQHEAAGFKGITLIICNVVKRAVEVYKELQKNKALLQSQTQLKLVHSRFRPHEREGWREEFLNRRACEKIGVNRIIVTTQVVEAGVDISADRLVTELAPWPSLVQRFGRCARWGGTAQVSVVDLALKSKAGLPYDEEELAAALDALGALQDVAPLSLERFEESMTEAQRALLYPYAPKHLLLRHEIDELFDTAPDLSGSDTDIGRYLRSGDERDVQVFWRSSPAENAAPDAKLRPFRDELCSAPIGDVKKWLFKDKSKTRAYRFDYLEGSWVLAQTDEINPGAVLLVGSGAGGYSDEYGFDPSSTVDVEPVKFITDSRIEAQALDADQSEESESLSETGYQTIASHGGQVAKLAAEIALQLVPEQRSLFHCAGRWHDVGKVHPAFALSIKSGLANRPDRNDLAKAPKEAWVEPKQMYRLSENEQRRGFRHELASTLALFDVLQRHEPNHPALLGDVADLLAATGVGAPEVAAGSKLPNPLETEILALSSDQFDLLAYLVCCHHGKVRLSWNASSFDQQANDTALRIRGVKDRESLPALHLMDAQGQFVELPESLMDLSPSAVGLSARTGRSWVDRVLGLLYRYGPFTLAYFEAVIRAADQRASRSPESDPLLKAHFDQTLSEHSSLTTVDGVTLRAGAAL